MKFNEFGKKIENLRRAINLSQAELAEKLNVNVLTVSKWENGIGFPDLHKIPLIAHTLETTTDYLFGCVRRQQKIFCFNIDESDTDGRRHYDAELNDKYLAQGWKVIHSSLSGAEGSTYMLVVLEKED